MLVNLTLSVLIELAYGVQDFQLIRPDWLDNARFDLTAETLSPLSRAEMLKLLRPELKERFGLQIHQDSKSMPVYRLTVAKGGLKVKPADTETGLNIRPLPGHAWELTGKASMANFASLLGAQTDRPGVDGTGMEGAFDFHLNYSREQSASDNSLPSAPLIFDALVDQLGLRFVAVKAPIEVWVVDHCERSPVGQ
jgi:uncharacterized protein (TIGR03435 family)